MFQTKKIIGYNYFFSKIESLSLLRFPVQWNHPIEGFFSSKVVAITGTTGGGWDTDVQCWKLVRVLIELVEGQSPVDMLRDGQPLLVDSLTG